jgi:hypothetical protein
MYTNEATSTLVQQNAINWWLLSIGTRHLIFPKPYIITIKQTWATILKVQIWDILVDNENVRDQLLTIFTNKIAYNELR